MNVHRHLLLLLLLAAICCSVQATTLTITVKDDVDLTPVSGVSIYMNGDYLGSTDINGRFYLYHSETGSFRLSVEKSGFYNWQSLVSNSKTYLTVELQRKTQVLTVSLYDSGTLDPISGALVKVTGGDIDRSDTSDSKGKSTFALPAGNIYNIEIRALNYETLFKTIEMQSVSKEIDCRLIRSDLFVVHVINAADSAPLPGVAVYVDEKYISETDSDGRVTCYLQRERSYPIRLEKEQYGTFSETHYIGSDDLVFEIVLSKAICPVSVAVYDRNKIPVGGAKVYIDSQILGDTDAYGRCSLINLVSGVHDIEVRHPGYMTYEKTVNIKSEGENLVVELDYAMADTTIIVEDSDFHLLNGAEVFVNGESIGKTSGNGQIKTQLSTHNSYEFSASADGYKTGSLTREIPMGSTVYSTTITLEKEFDLLFMASIAVVGIGMLGGIIYWFKNIRGNRRRKPGRRSQL